MCAKCVGPPGHLKKEKEEASNGGDYRSEVSSGSLKSDPEKLFYNLLTYKQAANYLGVSLSYLTKLKARGAISYVLIGNRGVRFRVISLNRWIEKREIA